MIPVLVAHRGYPARTPENTLAGMRAAIDAGACCIEFDVQMCADGEFIVMHDDNLLRTCGIDKSVFEYSLRELQQHSAHEAERLSDKYFPEKIPSLQHMLDLVSVHPGLTAFVEIKEESLDHWGVDAVMQKLIAKIDPYRRQCVIISFSEAAIAFTRQHSDIRTGWVLHLYDDAHRTAAEKLGPQFLICNQRKIDSDVLWPGSWLWMLYGIETAQLALAWGQRGVPLLETDFITELMENASLRENGCRYD